jgi:hypothetical protein
MAGNGYARWAGPVIRVAASVTPRGLGTRPEADIVTQGTQPPGGVADARGRKERGSSTCAPMERGRFDET